MFKAYVYVDGLNLYYSGLKGTPYKWLDPVALADLLATGFTTPITVEKVRYFTARVQSLPHDPLAPDRQHLYLRALQLNPRLQLHEGYFRSDKRYRTLVQPCLVAGCSLTGPVGTGVQAQVWQSEEKGSDVSFGAWMIRDCALENLDCVVAITNDSDLAEPLRLVRDEFGKQVFLLNPQRSRQKWTSKLSAVVTRAMTINTNALKRCQLPLSMADSAGMISKPTIW